MSDGRKFNDRQMLLASTGLGTVFTTMSFLSLISSTDGRDTPPFQNEEPAPKAKPDHKSETSR